MLKTLLSRRYCSVNCKVYLNAMFSKYHLTAKIVSFQSLNYDVCENVLYLKDQEKYKSKVCTQSIVKMQRQNIDNSCTRN